MIIIYLLKDKLYCGYCNKTMSAETGTARNGDVFRYYKCYGKKKTSKCKKGNVKREVIEKAVVDSIIETFNKADLNQIVEKVMLF